MPRAPYGMRSVGAIAQLWAVEDFGAGPFRCRLTLTHGRGDLLDAGKLGQQRYQGCRELARVDVHRGRCADLSPVHVEVGDLTDFAVVVERADLAGRAEVADVVQVGLGGQQPPG